MARAALTALSIQIDGSSVARLRTGFQVHGIGSLRIALDAGVHFDNMPDVFLITHAHHDHWRELNSCLLPCSGRETVRPKVMAPAASIALMAESICKARRATGQFQKCGACDGTASAHVAVDADFVPVKADDEIDLAPDVVVRVFALHHTVPTVGYGLYVRTQRLIDSLIGLDGRELKRRRLNNEKITTEVLVPKLAFICDTSATGFDRISDQLAKFRAVMVECTFIRPDQLARANSRKRRHMHLNRLVEFARSNPTVMVAAMHFSQEYSIQEIQDTFNDMKLPNLLPILH